MRRSVLGLILVAGILAVALGGCTRLILWNPMFHGLEFDKEIVFNVDGVGVKIDKFGFWNSRIGPECHLIIKNFTDDPIGYNFSDCKLHVGERVMSPYVKKVGKVTLRPGESVKGVLKFDLLLDKVRKSGRRFIPSPSQVRLELGKITSPAGDIVLPDIEYVYAYRRLHWTRFP